MSILVTQKSRIIVHGIFDENLINQIRQMMACSSPIVAGVSPGKGGEWFLEGKLPIFDSVKGAVDATGADICMIMQPPQMAADALFESIDSAVPLVICLTGKIPLQDMMRVKRYGKYQKTYILGPGSPGIFSPGEANAGIIPSTTTLSGKIGVVSRSSSLIFEILFGLKARNIGISTCVGIGSEPIKGMGFTEILELFEADPQTEQVILIGEIGGSDEEAAAEFIASKMTKPVIAYIVGSTAPAGTHFGHAGAIIERGEGTAEIKKKVLKNSRVRIANHPEEIYGLIIS